LDGTAGEPEGRGPDAGAPGPLHEVLQPARQEAVVELLEAHRYAASPRPVVPTRRTVVSVVRLSAKAPWSSVEATRFAGPQSRAPLPIRYTNEMNTAAANTTISHSPKAASCR